MKFDLDKAVEKYAAEQNAKIYRGSLLNDVELDECDWTQSTFDDGVPQNKYFNRCEDKINLVLDAGTALQVVVFEGKTSGRTIATFYINGMWFEAKGMPAAELIRELGHEYENTEGDENWTPEPAWLGRGR